MMTSLILWGSVCWMPLLIAYMLNNETKFKKNIVLGVTIPPDKQDDEEVNREIQTFRKSLYLITAGLIILVPVFILLSGKNTMMTYWGFWLTLAIVLPYIPYATANLRLKEIKEKNGWSPHQKQVVVDTSALAAYKEISPVWFVLPVILCFLPALINRDLLWFYCMMAFMCLLMWLSSKKLYRSKAEMVDDNTDLTKVLSQVRRRNWEKVWLMTEWLLVITEYLFVFSVYNTALSVILLFIITAGFVLYFLRMEMQTRKVQEKLTENSGEKWYVDDDDHWIGGLIYYNPDDSRLVMNNRIGLNSTVNAAHPLGKALMVLSAALLVFLPLSGVMMDQLGRQEISITAADGTVEAKAGITKYTFDQDSIVSCELLEELPENLVRVNGTGMDTLLKGNFYSNETGNVKVILDPETPPFILIRTDDKTYLFGTRDSEMTRQIYEVLK